MVWSAALNTAVGLMLVYLVFSVAASRINELVSGRLEWRAQALERALHTLLGGAEPPLKSAGAKADQEPVDTTAPPITPVLSAQALKNHPTIAALESACGKGRMASYLPSRAFSAAVLDILAPPAVIILDSLPAAEIPVGAKSAFDELRAHPDIDHLNTFTDALPADCSLRASTLPRLNAAINGDVLEQIRTAIVNLPEGNPARRPLLRMLTDADNSRDTFRSKLEHWYDDEMSRLTGWYKRYVQRFIIAYGIILTLAFNVDTITIAETLWRSPVEQVAIAQAAANTTGKTLDNVDTSISAIKGLDVPLGWTPIHDGHEISSAPNHFPEPSPASWLLKLLGLFVTACALAFGAPFWFDVLGKLARLRNAGGVTSTTEDSKRK